MEKKHIVVAGSGFAGLESAFLLRHFSKEKIKITIFSTQ
jgi:NADH dehydrogenase FAD-containing subunit